MRWCPICGKLIRAGVICLHLATAAYAGDGELFRPVDWSTPVRTVDVAPRIDPPPFYRIHDGSAELARRVRRQREAAYRSSINSQPNGSPPGLAWNAA